MIQAVGNDPMWNYFCLVLVKLLGRSTPETDRVGLPQVLRD